MKYLHILCVLCGLCLVGNHSWAKTAQQTESQAIDLGKGGQHAATRGRQPFASLVVREQKWRNKQATHIYGRAEMFIAGSDSVEKGSNYSPEPGRSRFSNNHLPFIVRNSTVVMGADQESNISNDSSSTNSVYSRGENDKFQSGFVATPKADNYVKTDDNHGATTDDDVFLVAIDQHRDFPPKVDVKMTAVSSGHREQTWKQKAPIPRYSHGSARTNFLHTGKGRGANFLQIEKEGGRPFNIELDTATVTADNDRETSSSPHQRVVGVGMKNSQRAKTDIGKENGVKKAEDLFISVGTNESKSGRRSSFEETRLDESDRDRYSMTGHTNVNIPSGTDVDNGAGVGVGDSGGSPGVGWGDGGGGGVVVADEDKMSPTPAGMNSYRPTSNQHYGHGPTLPPPPPPPSPSQLTDGTFSAARVFTSFSRPSFSPTTSATLPPPPPPSTSSSTSLPVLLPPSPSPTATTPVTLTTSTAPSTDKVSNIASSSDLLSLSAEYVSRPRVDRGFLAAGKKSRPRFAQGLQKARSAFTTHTDTAVPASATSQFTGYHSEGLLSTPHRFLSSSSVPGGEDASSLIMSLESGVAGSVDRGTTVIEKMPSNGDVEDKRSSNDKRVGHLYQDEVLRAQIPSPQRKEKAPSSLMSATARMFVLLVSLTGTQTLAAQQSPSSRDVSAHLDPNPTHTSLSATPSDHSNIPTYHQALPGPHPSYHPFSATIDASATDPPPFTVNRPFSSLATDPSSLPISSVIDDTIKAFIDSGESSRDPIRPRGGHRSLFPGHGSKTEEPVKGSSSSGQQGAIELKASDLYRASVRGEHDSNYEHETSVNDGSLRLAVLDTPAMKLTSKDHEAGNSVTHVKDVLNESYQQLQHSGVLRKQSQFSKANDLRDTQPTFRANGHLNDVQRWNEDSVVSMKGKTLNENNPNTAATTGPSLPASVGHHVGHSLRFLPHGQSMLAWVEDAMRRVRRSVDNETVTGSGDGENTGIVDVDTTVSNYSSNSSSHSVDLTNSYPNNNNISNGSSNYSSNSIGLSMDGLDNETISVDVSANNTHSLENNNEENINASLMSEINNMTSNANDITVASSSKAVTITVISDSSRGTSAAATSTTSSSSSSVSSVETSNVTTTLPVLTSQKTVTSHVEHVNGTDDPMLTTSSSAVKSENSTTEENVTDSNSVPTTKLTTDPNSVLTFTSESKLTKEFTITDNTVQPNKRTTRAADDPAQAGDTSTVTWPSLFELDLFTTPPLTFTDLLNNGTSSSTETSTARVAATPRVVVTTEPPLSLDPAAVATDAVTTQQPFGILTDNTNDTTTRMGDTVEINATQPEAEGDPEAESGPDHSRAGVGGQTNSTGDEEGSPEGEAEPGPQWDVAKAEYGGWWQLHLYLFAFLFLTLGVYTLICVIRLWRIHRLMSRRYFVSLNLLMLALCLTRVVYLTAGDGYNSNGLFHDGVDYFLYSISFPCLTAAFSIQLYALLQATRMQFLPPTIQKLSWLIVIVAVHFIISVVTDVIVGMFAGMRILLFLCQLVFILWGIFLFLGYAYIFKRLYVHALKRQKLQHNTLNAMNGANGKPAKSKFTLSVAVKVTFLTAILGLVTVGLEVYGIVEVYKSAVMGKVEPPQPWPWYVYHTVLRLIEFLMCATMSYVASQPFRYRRGKQSSCWTVLCAPCAEIFCCGSDVNHTDAQQAGWSEHSDGDHHRHHSRSSNGVASTSTVHSPAFSAKLTPKSTITNSNNGKGDYFVLEKEHVTPIYVHGHYDVTPVVTSPPSSRPTSATSDSDERTESTRGSLTSGGGDGGDVMETTGRVREDDVVTEKTSPVRVAARVPDSVVLQAQTLDSHPHSAFLSSDPVSFFPDPRAAAETGQHGALNNRYQVGENEQNNGSGSVPGFRSRFSSSGSSDLFMPPPGSLSLANSMDFELDRAFRSIHEDHTSRDRLSLSRDRMAASSPSLQQLPVLGHNQASLPGNSSWNSQRDEDGGHGNGINNAFSSSSSTLHRSRSAEELGSASSSELPQATEADWKTTNSGRPKPQPKPRKLASKSASPEIEAPKLDDTEGDGSSNPQLFHPHTDNSSTVEDEGQSHVKNGSDSYTDALTSRGVSDSERRSAGKFSRQPVSLALKEKYARNSDQAKAGDAQMCENLAANLADNASLDGPPTVHIKNETDGAGSDSHVRNPPRRHTPLRGTKSYEGNSPSSSSSQEAGNRKPSSFSKDSTNNDRSKKDNSTNDSQKATSQDVTGSGVTGRSTSPPTSCKLQRRAFKGSLTSTPEPQCVLIHVHTGGGSRKGGSGSHSPSPVPDVDCQPVSPTQAVGYGLGLANTSSISFKDEESDIEV